jgi:uncharacterized RDD family membrane protein YckC
MNDARESAPTAEGSPREPTAAPVEGAPPQPPLGAPKEASRRPPDTLRRRWKKLLQLKNQFSSSFAVIGAASAVWSLGKFIVGAGNLSYPVLGFAAVSLFGLLVPGGAPRLFALRAFAFAIDGLFLGILTVAFLPFLYEADAGGPSEFAITCVVWLWFVYFAFFDWRFRGTPGKRMLGLRVLVRGAKFGFLKQLLRAFLTLLLPVVAGAWWGSCFRPALLGLALPLCCLSRRFFCSRTRFQFWFSAAVEASLIESRVQKS